MKMKAKGELKYEMCKCPDGNFSRNWRLILKKAGIDESTVHDLRSTCITEWFEKGLLPHEVRKLAGHADINTTMNHYVGIGESLIDGARGASSAALDTDCSVHLVRGAQNGKNRQEKNASISSEPLAFDRVTETHDSAA